MLQIIRWNSLILLLIVLIWIIQMTKAIPKFRFHKIFSLKYSIYLEKYNSILVNVRSFFDWPLGEGNFFFLYGQSRELFWSVVGIIIIIMINLFFGSTHLKIKTLIMELRNLCYYVNISYIWNRPHLFTSRLNNIKCTTFLFFTYFIVI